MIRMLLALTLAVAASAPARTVTDSAGRVVEVPDAVDTRLRRRPAGLGAPLRAEARGAARLAPRAAPRGAGPTRRALPRPARDRPADRPRRRGEPRALLAIEPDLIIDFGSVRDTYATSPTGCRSRPASPTS